MQIKDFITGAALALTDLFPLSQNGNTRKITLDALKTFITADVNSSLSERVKKTTADITYYISPTGNDSNDGLTSGAAFKTIQYAINKLPQVVNHTVNIILAQGTYSEDVQLSGFNGKGFLNITGDSAISSLYNVSSITGIQISIRVTTTGICFTKTGNIPLVVTNSTDFIIGKCKVSNSDTLYPAIGCYRSNVSINGCQLDNRVAGIRAADCANVYSDGNTGSGNTIGLQSQRGSTIAKNGTQPSGTTAEQVTGGGVIR